MLKPAVSIILTTYNGFTRGYLEEAIQSVLAQTCHNYELILVDDGSNDATASLCKAYLKEAHIHYHYQENRGLSAARNAGIQRARGEYLLFLDDDDLYEKELVEKMWKAYASHKDPKIGMLYCAYTLVNKGGKAFASWYVPANGNIYERLFLDNYAGSPSGTMVHRAVFEKVGLFKEDLRCCEDYDMWLRIAKEYHAYSLEEPLLRYRVHGANMSGNICQLEIYSKKVIDSALETSPAHIQAASSHYYHRLYMHCAAKYFEVGEYRHFRRCCDQSHRYQSVGLKWRSKYWLSYLPRLTKKLFEIKRRQKKL